MLRAFSDDGGWSGASADAAAFKEQAERTVKNLETAAKLTVAAPRRTARGLEVDVTVENRTGLLQFVAPLRFLDGWLESPRESSSNANRSSTWDVQLADQTLPTADVAGLRVGDLLQTDHPVAHPLLAQSESGEVVPVRVGEVEGERLVRRST